MAFTAKAYGVLVGYGSYTKDGKESHTYSVLICEKRNKETGLYGACALAEVREDSAVLENPKYGQKVSLWGEVVTTSKGAFMSYSGIESAEEKTK